MLKEEGKLENIIHTRKEKRRKKKVVRTFRETRALILVSSIMSIS